MYFPCEDNDSACCLFKVDDKPVYEINASLTAIHDFFCQKKLSFHHFPGQSKPNPR